MPGVIFGNPVEPIPVVEQEWHHHIPVGNESPGTATVDRLPVFLVKQGRYDAARFQGERVPFQLRDDVPCKQDVIVEEEYAVDLRIFVDPSQSMVVSYGISLIGRIEQNRCGR